jgi:hypothetical protein
MGAFRTRMCLCGRSLLGRRPLCEFVSASKISVPRSSGDRFDDWVMGLQFEPSYLHHPVSANRAFPARRQIGRFCGHFRPVDSRILVSGGVRAFWLRFLAPCLCIQKFRSRLPALSARSDRICGRNSDLWATMFRDFGPALHRMLVRLIT